jgi:hypothetical protein
MVSQLNTAQREQSKGAERLLASVEKLRDLNREQSERFERDVVMQREG